MTSLDVFNTEFSDILNQIPVSPVTPELVVANLPYGLFLQSSRHTRSFFFFQHFFFV